MARRKVTVRDIGEILDHWHSGRGIRTVARSLAVSRLPIRKYVAIERSHGDEVGGSPLALVEGVLDCLISKAHHIMNGKSSRPRPRPGGKRPSTRCAMGGINERGPTGMRQASRGLGRALGYACVPAQPPKKHQEGR